VEVSEMAGELEYINFDEGIKRVMNNVKLYVKLITKFKADTNLDELLAPLAAEDYEKAQTAAHTLKGVSANLSLTELFKQTLELETQVKARNVNPSQIDKVKTVFSETIKEIDKVIEQND
jgi:HPt (histidine-containing phosphotransfer) domain-containing protein